MKYRLDVHCEGIIVEVIPGSKQNLDWWVNLLLNHGINDLTIKKIPETVVKK